MEYGPEAGVADGYSDGSDATDEDGDGRGMEDWGGEDPDDAPPADGLCLCWTPVAASALGIHSESEMQALQVSTLDIRPLVVYIVHLLICSSFMCLNMRVCLTWPHL